MKFKPSRGKEIFDMLTKQSGQAIRGVKIEWSSVHGPGHPFGGGFESAPGDQASAKAQEDLEPGYPCRALKAGVKGLSTNQSPPKGKRYG